MPTRPRIPELARDAREFVHANTSMLQHYAAPLVGPLIVCGFLSVVGATLPISKIWQATFAIFPLLSIYFSSCFVLDWHRAVLLGVKPSHRVNPFGLKRGEGKFIALFYGLTFLPILPGLLVGLPAAWFLRNHQTPQLIDGIAIAAVILIIALIILIMRLSFMLPARSVNTPVSPGEARRISKGLLWPLIAAVFLATILPMLLLVAIRIIASLIAARILHWPETTLPGASFIFVFAGIPAIVIDFVILARNVTILSRLYQWSVQNCPLPESH